jgi:uncharacterized protein (DUF608 family)
MKHLPSPPGALERRPAVSKLPRRHFLRLSTLGSLSLAVLGRAARAAQTGDGQVRLAPDHFIPVDKGLKPEWLRSLFAKGEPEWFRGRELDTIGMPVGGICAGQVYLTGEGRLAYWDVFNQNHNTGYGAVNWREGRGPELKVQAGRLVEDSPVRQGFAVRIRQGDKVETRPLSRQGFHDVAFRGEYPIGRVDYADADTPLRVRLEAFSPFIPLNARDSALPCTLLNYTLENCGAVLLEVTLAGWLSNAVCRHSATDFAGRLERTGRTVCEGGLAGFTLGARATAAPRPAAPPTVFADFEGGDYGAWTVEGAALGARPAAGTLPNQQPVSGYAGKGLVNTFLGGDTPHGRLTSPEFTIERPFLSFLIGGGSHQNQTCVNLLVDGQVVRTATGKDNERLTPHNWDVAELRGRRARIEIVDAASGPWGHINVDQIEFRDDPMSALSGELHEQADFGSLGLFALDAAEAETWLNLPAEGDWPALFDAKVETSADAERLSAAAPAPGGVVRVTRQLKPGAAVTVSFAVVWHFPNLFRDDRRVGNYYARRFPGAVDVARYVHNDFPRLAGETRRWCETYYDSTLPWWLLDRLHSTAANLATTTCQWWQNGRFWAWEGGGCCHGTCGHVWNYAHTLARLFPELERSVREHQDFAEGVGLRPNGAIGFRGEGWDLWAGDSQGGYLLKAYREHQCAPDDAFLNRNWPAIKRAVEFLIQQDGNGDGLIEGQQHQTYDENYFGANTFVGALYLGALRAAEEMAREVGDEAFARKCRAIFEAGRKASVERLFNGEYFIQDVDLKQHPDWQYADGCLADQLFGQGWAHQVGLGYLYPETTVRTALASVWKYCWAPDMTAQNAAHPPERWFVSKGDAGLFTCAWPRSRHLGPKSTRYRDEIWTGIEYQVAGHMAWEGLLTEALAICRAIHDRYHPRRFNPWNEIECGDHYARALASWGVLTGLAGFEYHGPRGHLGFAPRLTPEDFRCAFTAADGWGTLSQRRAPGRQANTIAVRWGRVRLRSLAFEAADGFEPRSVQVTLAGRGIPAELRHEDRRCQVSLAATVWVEAGQRLEVVLE